MAIFSNWKQCVQQWTTITTINIKQQCDSEPPGRHGRANNKSCEWTGLFQYKLHDNNTWRGISVYSDLRRAWSIKSNSDSKSYRSNKRNRHHKYLYPIALCLTNLAIAPVTLAADVGGVSATANPIANSSGSVTNQAIQVLQGPYITNTYGGGISCQGPTANFTPYITHARNNKDPFERYYLEPQYDARDFKGRKVEVQKNVKNWPWEDWYNTQTYINEEGEEVRAYEDGQDMTITVMEVQGDGVPDKPGHVLWNKPIRTGMARNYSTSIGLSATLSLPLDGGLQERCKQAAETQIALQSQLLANKRLDFELARLKNCGELMKAGIRFHPRSQYGKICADVLVQNVNVIAPHRHSIPRPTSSSALQNEASSARGSSVSAQPAVPRQIIPGSSYPVRQQPSSIPSSQSVSPLLTKDQQEVLRSVPKSWQPLQSTPLPSQHRH